MQQVFINQSPIENRFVVENEDAHHLIKVVRIKEGERLRVSTDDNSYICQVESLSSDKLVATIIEEVPSTELTSHVYLFQAIPKGDRMETIIEKCVELGVYEIIPVEMKNCVVKLDDKKKEQRIRRFQAIADTAAKQSKRSLIPTVKPVMTFKEALEYAKKCNIKLLPYENKNGMKDTVEVLSSITPGSEIAVFIGPEGGFDASEIALCEKDYSLVSLGKRILRTDTAAIMSLSLISYYSEIN